MSRNSTVLLLAASVSPSRLHFVVMVMPGSELHIYVLCLEHLSPIQPQAATAYLGPRSSDLAGKGVAVHRQL